MKKLRTHSTTIKNISWKTIQPIWQNHLWPTRESPIETHSAMTWPYDGEVSEYDMEIFNYEATFCGVFVDGVLAAVGSGHKSSDKHYRMRGFWVFPEYRHQGYLTMMLDILCNKATVQGCDIIWGIPRYANILAYTKFGFETIGEPFGTETSEANIYAFKQLP